MGAGGRLHHLVQASIAMRVADVILEPWRRGGGGGGHERASRIMLRAITICWIWLVPS